LINSLCLEEDASWRCREYPLTVFVMQCFYRSIAADSSIKVWDEKNHSALFSGLNFC
jgi:hypothetical protein